MAQRGVSTVADSPTICKRVKSWILSYPQPVCHLRLTISLRLQTHDYLLPTDDQSPDHTEKYNKRVQRFSNRTIRFLHQVISHLSKTIDAWDSFQKGDLGYFSRLESFSGRAGSYSRLLLTVEKHIAELRDLRREVEDQKHLMESIEREVSRRLGLHNGNRWGEDT